MTQPNDGGPAFPVPMVRYEDHFFNVHDGGMSLRDWFATQASEQDIEEHTYNNRSREQAKYAYADAMLRARSANVSGA